MSKVIPVSSHAKRYAPAAERNQEVIYQALQSLISPKGALLEVASGSGQHAVYFARRFPDVMYQPSDIDPIAVESITAWRAEAQLDNLKAPIELNTATLPWPVLDMDVVYCANMVHISPWGSTEGLFKGSAQILSRDGKLLIYGPFMVNNQPTTPSNAQFHVSLQEKNPDWGLRDLSRLDQLAAECGLRRTTCLDMPANNFLLEYQMSGSQLLTKRT